MAKKNSLLKQLELLFPEKSKEELYSRILCGEVLVNGGAVKDPKFMIDSSLEIAFRENKFVSRGGDKLYHSLKVWNINLKGKVILDAGSSTGGFTDALLQSGADKVHAVDVGYNQIAYKLRRDPRVILHENSNILDITSLSPPADGAAADLSFRSLSGAAAHILALTREKWCIALAKPQFEWKHPPKEFRGVVKDRSSLMMILSELLKDLEREGVFLQRFLLSPVPGRKGNREFLFYLTLERSLTQEFILQSLEEILAQADI